MSRSVLGITFHLRWIEANVKSWAPWESAALEVLTIYFLEWVIAPVNLPDFPKIDHDRSYHAVPPGNIHETSDLRGDLFIFAQISHCHPRSSRVRNDSRHDVTVLRFKVFDHNVYVHDV